MSVKHKDQRVGVLVDIQNMYYSAKQLYHKKVNFTNLLKTAVAGRQLIRAMAYVINAEMQGEEGFHQALERIGFEVKAKDLQTFLGGAKKGDWDVGMAMDALRMAQKVDVIVLVSGDGDFIDLVRYLQETMGCRVEVISFKKTCSQKLIDQADEYISIDDPKFLISDRRGSDDSRRTYK